MACLIFLLEGIKEIVVTLAAAAGVYIAYSGLRTWRRQLIGQSEYEVARRFLRSAYAVRDAIGYVRSPIMDEAELAAGAEMAEESEIEADRQHTATLVGAYNLRWKYLATAWSDLLVEKLEAEAIWGQDVNDWIGPLKLRVARLKTSLQLYFKYREQHPCPLGEKRFEKIWSDVYSTSGKEDRDEFEADLEGEIAQLEAHLRPKLSL